MDTSSYLAGHVMLIEVEETQTTWYASAPVNLLMLYVQQMCYPLAFLIASLPDSLKHSLSKR